VIERLAEVAGRPVSRETFEKLEAYVALLEDESQRQNLVSRATLDHIWDRHILDSAQLVRFEPHAGVSWVDIGSGAGLPGIVIACLIDGPVALVEPRRLRAEFLHKAVAALELNAEVLAMKAERVERRFDAICARAVARLEDLFKLSHHLSTRNSVWVLPKGRNAERELAEARRAWQGAFHVERSVTDAESWIIVGTGVKAKAR